MADPEDWAVDANEALEITLLGPSGSRPRTFHPTFTYPIFGDAETIYGYKGLSLDLSFAAWDFRAYLKVRWDEKIDNALEIEAENVEEPLLNNLPEGDSSSFSQLLTPQRSSFATRMISSFTLQIHLSLCQAPKSNRTL
jgi:Histone acetyl transferase HAT1 N-terminus